MAAFSTIIGAMALGLSAAGTYMSYTAGKAQAAAQADALAEQKKAEALRQRQMNLDAQRRKKEVIRTALQARSASLATATSQGAQLGSVLPGAYGEASGRSGVNSLGINQNQEIGNSIFSANMAATDAYRRSALAGGDAALGAGLSSLGGAVLKNIGVVDKIGVTLGAKYFGGFGARGARYGT